MMHGVVLLWKELPPLTTQARNDRFNKSWRIQKKSVALVRFFCFGGTAVYKRKYLIHTQSGNNYL